MGKNVIKHGPGNESGRSRTAYHTTQALFRLPMGQSDRVFRLPLSVHITPSKDFVNVRNPGASTAEVLISKDALRCISCIVFM